MTRYSCDEEPTCKVNWLNVKVAKAVIREIRETDGFVDFDQKVSEIAIPMSSRQAAQAGASTLAELLAGRRK